MEEDVAAFGEAEADGGFEGRVIDDEHRDAEPNADAVVHVVEHVVPVVRHKP